MGDTPSKENAEKPTYNEPQHASISGSYEVPDTVPTQVGPITSNAASHRLGTVQYAAQTGTVRTVTSGLTERKETTARPTYNEPQHASVPGSCEIPESVSTQMGPVKSYKAFYPKLESRVVNADVTPQMDTEPSSTPDKSQHYKVLLLGETGVGKSTFINSVVNYAVHRTFRSAENGKLNILIPTKYSVADKNKKQVEVVLKTEKDQKNENLTGVGASATQDLKTYVCTLPDGRTLSLIDTPGMGDTRGFEQDQKNCENILDYIGRLHNLNAICFLFQSNNSRITAFFKYCLEQILTRLDKSASKNIIFIFTNCRATDYTGGQTYVLLQEIVRQIKENKGSVDIPFGDENVFCVDNEAFRLLGGLEKGVEFNDYQKRQAYHSWKRAFFEYMRLIKYIGQLKPHHVQNTSCVNEARRMIIQLSKPVADISELINDSIHALNQHKACLQSNNETVESLKKKLYIPVLDLKTEKLAQPKTICTSSKCAELYKVGDKSKWHYKSDCHKPCYLTNIPPKIVGDPRLKNCASMDTQGMCNKCSCMFNVHMHIYFDTKVVENKIVDVNIEKNIKTNEQCMESASKIILKIEERARELEEEQKCLLRSTAYFACFLQENAITPISDCYLEYMEYLISRERALGDKAIFANIQQLENLKRQYVEVKKALDVKPDIDVSAEKLTPIKVNNIIQNLFKLKHFGKKIKEMYELQKNARKAEFKDTEIRHEIEKVDLSSTPENTEDQTKEDKCDQFNKNKFNRNQRGGKPFQYQNRNPNWKQNYQQNYPPNQQGHFSQPGNYPQTSGQYYQPPNPAEQQFPQNPQYQNYQGPPQGSNINPTGQHQNMNATAPSQPFGPSYQFQPPSMNNESSCGGCCSSKPSGNVNVIITPAPQPHAHQCQPSCAGHSGCSAQQHRLPSQQEPMGGNFPCQPQQQQQQMGGNFPYQPQQQQQPMGGNFSCQPQQQQPVGGNFPCQPQQQQQPMGGNLPIEPQQQGWQPYGQQQGYNQQNCTDPPPLLSMDLPPPYHCVVGNSFHSGKRAYGGIQKHKAPSKNNQQHKLQPKQNTHKSGAPPKNNQQNQNQQKQNTNKSGAPPKNNQQNQNQQKQNTNKSGAPPKNNQQNQNQQKQNTNKSGAPPKKKQGKN